MTVTGTKKGLTPSRRRGGAVNNGAVNEYPIANAYAGSFFHGDPVKLSLGVLCSATATKPVLGVFQGCQYIDPTTKQLVQSSYFPSGTSSAGVINGYSQPLALVVDDPGATYMIPCKTSVTLGDIGSRYRVSLGAGSTLTGQSTAIIDKALTVSTTKGAHVQIIDIMRLPDNTPFTGAAGTMVEVILASAGPVGAQ